MKRIMIIGASGSGKTTLAVRLGDVTGLPVFHIDPMYYTSGWVQRPREETLAMVRRTVALDRWIFDGNFTSTFSERVARSDVLIFLDIPTVTRLRRVIWRTIKGYGKIRAGSAEGCPERFDWEFLKFVAGYRKRGRIEAMKLLKTVPEGVCVYHVRSTREVGRVLTELSCKPQPGPAGRAARTGD